MTANQTNRIRNDRVRVSAAAALSHQSRHHSISDQTAFQVEAASPVYSPPGHPCTLLSHWLRCEPCHPAEEYSIQSGAPRPGTGGCWCAGAGARAERFFVSSQGLQMQIPPKGPSFSSTLSHSNERVTRLDFGGRVCLSPAFFCPVPSAFLTRTRGAFILHFTILVLPVDACACGLSNNLPNLNALIELLEIVALVITSRAWHYKIC